MTRWPEAHRHYKKGHELEWRTRRPTKARLEKAILHHSRAIEIDDQHSYALEALGILTYDTLSDSTRALGLLRKAAKIDPTLHDANLFAGWILAERGEEAAIPFLEQATRVSGRNVGTMCVFALALYRLERQEEAERLFARSYERRPLGASRERAQG
jgi:tetratricopeptide (TPR) repeat protein